MNIKLTLGERLKDLRVERQLKLETLAERTGLSKSALAKYESDDVADVSLYAIATLAEFYGVTTDYLLGMTENKKRSDAVLSDLHLSDGAVDVLRNGKFNHRLLCELLEHPDFSRWMTDLEICVDGLVSDRIRDMNVMMEATRQELEKRYHADTEDLTMRTLKAAQINEDEYFGRILHAEAPHKGRDAGQAQTLIICPAPHRENAAAAGRRTYTIGSSASLRWVGKDRQQPMPFHASFCHRTGACRICSQPLFRVSRNQGVTH